VRVNCRCFKELVDFTELVDLGQPRRKPTRMKTLDHTLGTGLKPST
jgi:hypothetical protein